MSISRTALIEYDYGNKLLGLLKDSNGRAPGLICIMPENATTFIKNRDTCSAQNLWPFPSDKVMQGNAYILTHPGTNSVAIGNLRIKSASSFHLGNGTASRQAVQCSAVRIIAADSNIYMAAIDEKIVMKIGPRMEFSCLLPPGSKLATSGNDYAVWEI